MKIKEDFLHHIWKYKRFDHRDLKTTEGQDLHIEKYGVHNHASGPDFHNGRISIMETKWAGNIELHIKSSDWKRHKHQHDKAYDNVILHVVYEHDESTFNSKGQSIPTFELKGRMDQALVKGYEALINNTAWIPCENQIETVEDIIIKQAVDRALIQRLEKRSAVLEDSLNYYNNDWNKVCYQSIASALGAKINSSPFEHLARTTPLEILSKSSDQLFQLEALLFGQAGFLEEKPHDEYQEKLTKEYVFLRHKYKLLGMKKESWQFSSLRPLSFPHVRIAQFARIIFNQPTLFARIKNIENVKEIDDIFSVELDGYWLTHYNFSKISKPKSKTIGKVARNNILINSIVPILFAYGDRMKDQETKDRALELLEKLAPEKNSIITKWKVLGVNAESSHDSQGLLQLKNECCNFKKCLECPIGIGLLKA